MSDMETLLAELEARTAITDLIHRYAFNIRHGRIDAFEPLLTEDAEFHILSADPAGDAEPVERGRHIGRDAVTAYLGTPNRTGFRVFPMIRNLLIEVDGKTATSSCLMSSRSYPIGAEVFGEYADEFRLEDRWRFSRRRFTVYAKPQPRV